MCVSAADLNEGGQVSSRSEHVWLVLMEEGSKEGKATQETMLCFQARPGACLVGSIGGRGEAFSSEPSLPHQYLCVPV